MLWVMIRKRFLVWFGVEAVKEVISQTYMSLKSRELLYQGFGLSVQINPMQDAENKNGWKWKAYLKEGAILLGLESIFNEPTKEPKIILLIHYIFLKRDLQKIIWREGGRRKGCITNVNTTTNKHSTTSKGGH